MTTGLLWGSVAFLLSLALTGLCMPLARRLGAVARPRADRWHRKEIPLLGGLGIAVSTVVVGVAAEPADSKNLILLAGAACIALVGLVDDLRTIKPQTKLLGQLLAATFAVAMGLRLSLTGEPFVDLLLTLFWIVALTNAFNLLDNMDGLAAGIAAIACGFRLAFFGLDDDTAGAVPTAVLLGASLGFLVFNRNPARIFMGDAGSMFLGYLVAGLSLVGGYPYSRGMVSILLLPVLLLLVPIFDTAFVTVTRVLARRPISVGGRDHTSHRLVALGLSEKRAVDVLYLLAAASGGVAYLSYRFGFSRSAVLIVFLILSVGMLALYLSRVQVHGPAAQAPLELAPLLRMLADFSATRQVGTVLLDFVLIIAAYHTAYLLRFEGNVAPVQDLFLRSLPIVIACQMTALTAYRTYQGIWRYVGLVDLVRLVKAVTVGTIAAVAAIALAFQFERYSRATLILDWLLLTVFLCGSRISFRLLGELLRPQPPQQRRVLIYGAGDGGELALREMQQNTSLQRTPLGFLDDDPAKRRRHIRGVAVLGGIERLEDVLAREKVDEVIVASHKIPAERIEQLAAACEAHGVAVTHAGLRLVAHEHVA